MTTSLLTQVQAQVTKIVTSYVVETESSGNSSRSPTGCGERHGCIRKLCSTGFIRKFTLKDFIH